MVRLKGGDPFVFGRGGEEALALPAAGVAFEVVPGVTSAIAAPAYAGVPVTHRGLATSFTVVAGHSRSVDRPPGEGGTNWEALAAAGGTIVVLMGAAHAGRIAERLMAGGLAPARPSLAVQWGTEPQQEPCARPWPSWHQPSSGRRSPSSSGRWPASTSAGTEGALCRDDGRRHPGRAPGSATGQPPPGPGGGRRGAARPSP